MATTSQNGWPVLTSDSPYLHAWVIPTRQGNVRLRLRRGSAGFLLSHLALWFNDEIDPLIDPVLDDWGYAYRKIGATSMWSDHASATAVDLDSSKHPQGVRGTFTAAQTTAIRTRLKVYGGAIAWGGDWNNVDEMHFSIAKPFVETELVARSLLDTPRGKAILGANPGQKAVILS